MASLLASLTSVGALVVAVLYFKSRHLLPLFQSSNTIALDFSPTRLSRFDAGIILFVLVWRSFTRFVLITLRLRRLDDDEKTLSKAERLSLVMPLRTTTADLDAYAAAVGGVPSDDHPRRGPLLVMLLSALTEPAMLLLLASKACQIRPVGSVNVRNHMELLRPDLCTSPLDGAYLTAECLQSDFRRVKRGFEIDLTVTLEVDAAATNTVDGDHKSSTTVFRQTFTILQFAKVAHDSVSSRPSVAAGVDETAWSHPITFTVPHDAPAKWAKVCKDYNPIHTSRAAARMLGFSGVIAHGNHVAALALAASDLPFPDEPLWMDVEFRRPVVVPSRLCTRTAATDFGGTAFQVLRGDKLCIDGKIGHKGSSTFKHQ